MASSGGAGGAGGSGKVDAAIGKYQKAQEDASARSMEVATKVTEINGIHNAIKKISPA